MGETHTHTHTQPKQNTEKTQINKVRNEKGEVKTDTTEIWRVMRKYYEQLYANKTNNLAGMDKFLGMYNLPRLNHNEIESMNEQTSSY